MKQKAKLATSILAVGLTVALMGGSTMAWFTDSKNVAPATFTAGTVEIQAGQSVVPNDPNGKAYYEEVGPYRVASSHRGTNRAGSQLQDRKGDSRADPQNVLARNSGMSGDKKMYSLGYGGSIVVELSKALKKGDVLVIEDTWGGSTPTYFETAKVSVSQDNSAWTDAGTISNQTGSGDFHVNTLASPIENAKFIRLTDTTPKYVGPNSRLNDSDDGFDIDYICARNILDEENWNPGDTNKIAFYINNSGTKDIQVRVKLTAQWVGKDGKTAPLSTDVVNIVLPDGSSWEQHADKYYYYKGYLQGTKGGETAEAASHPSRSELNLTVTLKGAETGNQYQGMTYQITPTFEAIQNSHSGSWSWDNFDTYNH